MQLINNQPSPFGRKVLIGLYEKGLSCEIIPDIPWAEDTIVGQYNPLEQLPILITDQGEYLYDSSYILDWLERHYPEPALMPSNVEAIDKVKKLQVLAEGVMAAVVTVSAEMQRASSIEAWLARHRRKVVGGIREIAQMTKGNQYAVDDRLSHADIAIASTMDSIAFIEDKGFSLTGEIDWREAYPELADYIAGLNKRPAFRDTLPRVMNVNMKNVLA